MNYDEASPRAARRTGGESETVTEHEKRQRQRSERMRKWRKETRHPRTSDLDERTEFPLQRRFSPG